MIENIKMLKMELDSIKFIKNQKKTGEYEKLLEQDKNSKNKKMEILQIKSVRIIKNKNNFSYNKNNFLKINSLY